MAISSDIKPTRMELKKTKARLKTAVRGHKLLKDKHDELMRQFLIIVRENRALREKVEQGLDKVDAFSAVFKDMLALAQAEKSMQLMAAEIERTRRRVNALEYVMIPEMEQTIRYITMKLEENERGNITRLMKVKDQILQEAHGYEY